MGRGFDLSDAGKQPDNPTGGERKQKSGRLDETGREKGRGGCEAAPTLRFVAAADGVKC